MINAANKNQDAAPGHWIKVRGVARNAADDSDITAQVTAWKWVIGGEVVKTYVVTKEKAEKTNLAAGDLTARTVNYYYIAGSGGQGIKLTATIAGQSIDVSDTITVRPPEEVSLTTKTTRLAPATKGVAIGNPGFGGGIELHYGGSTDAGITWTGNAKAPTVNCPGVLDGRGHLATLQLVNLGRTRTLDDGTKQKFSTGGIILDRTAAGVGPEYGDLTTPVKAGAKGIHTTDDTPGSPLAGRKETSVDEQFYNYLMYKPGGANSIYVSLAKVDWFWKGSGTKKADGTWEGPTGADAAIDPKGAATSSLPTWTNFSGNVNWVPAP